MRAARGQSEVVGVVLLTAVVVVAVSVGGALVLMEWQAETTQDPRVNVHTDLTATTLTVQHMGGETLATPDIVVLVETSEGTDRRTLVEFDGPGERFEPGTSWRLSLRDGDDPFTGVVEVFVIHEPSNTILHDEKHDLTGR